MNSNRTEMELKGERELVIRRTFRAPAHIVFDAWTKAELVKRWWAPKSRGVAVVECTAEVRPGGAYRYVLARGEAERFAFSGKYLEVDRPTRLVYTNWFEAIPGAEVTVTVTFEERDGSTKLVAHELYPSKEARDGALASGMESGMRETIDQLDELVASLCG
jgi:uncharacterized protein YndB with AHSA1/START domain